MPRVFVPAATRAGGAITAGVRNAVARPPRTATSLCHGPGLLRWHRRSDEKPEDHHQGLLRFACSDAWTPARPEIGYMPVPPPLARVREPAAFSEDPQGHHRPGSATASCSPKTARYLHQPATPRPSQSVRPRFPGRPVPPMDGDILFVLRPSNLNRPYGIVQESRRRLTPTGRKIRIR